MCSTKTRELPRKKKTWDLGNKESNPGDGGKESIPRKMGGETDSQEASCVISSNNCARRQLYCSPQTRALETCPLEDDIKSCRKEIYTFARVFGDDLVIDT